MKEINFASLDKYPGGELLKPRIYDTTTSQSRTVNLYNLNLN